MHSYLILSLAAISCTTAKIYDDFSELPSKDYDFIIAGGGTAGLVVANRLTEDPRVNVLVIEAGESHQGIIDLQVPWLASRLELADAPFDWNTISIPQAGLNGRSLKYPRARVLGGSSSHSVWFPPDGCYNLNTLTDALIWMRGSRDDYDKWAEITGDDGWSWERMIPYFKKTERWTAAPGHGSEHDDFNPCVHGFHGPLGISLNNVIQQTDPLIIQTSKDLPDEFPFIEDLNAGRPIGVGSRHQLTATKELILSAGVVGTPQILLNSGIGDPTELKQVGVHPIFSLPSVGKNFSAETLFLSSWAANETIVNLNANETASAEALQQWITSRTGPMTAGSVATLAYFRLPDDSPAFDGNHDPSAGPNTPHFGIAINANGYFAGPPDPTLFVLSENSEPASRGSVSLKSTNPFELPLLDLGFYSASVDLAIAKESFKTVQRYVTTPAWKEFTLNRLAPPPDVTADSDDLVQYIRNSTGTSSHGIGTSAMSRRGAKHGVVDPDLRVKGISGLRIIDAGIIPFSPAANTQAPVYAVAERASDLIKQAWQLE